MESYPLICVEIHLSILHCERTVGNSVALMIGSNSLFDISKPRELGFIKGIETSRKNDACLTCTGSGTPLRINHSVDVRTKAYNVLPSSRSAKYRRPASPNSSQTCHKRMMPAPQCPLNCLPTVATVATLLNQIVLHPLQVNQVPSSPCTISNCVRDATIGVTPVFVPELI
jgi:hypothetical protein